MNQFIKKALDLNKSVNITIDGLCMSPLLKDGEGVQVKKHIVRVILFYMKMEEGN
ncbi:hypothetical protein [Bacillus sp. TSA_307]|uniref:hypothetical protein n=1 Tax=Bacillus sp. TSA_307 TaxID=3415651 RepID=UPI003E490BE3